MKVLLINGSPRANGCTFTALSEVAKTLQEEGVETEIVSIGNKAIRGCIGCGGCSKNNHRCVFADDICNEILDKAQTCDGYVFGSPVYFASVNGSMLALMDRLFYAGGAVFAQKPAACVTSARRAGTTATLEQLMKYPTIRQMPVISADYWPMVHGSNPEEVAKDEEGLHIMRVLGHNMAWMLKCIEAGKQAGINPPVAEPKVNTNFIR